MGLEKHEELELFEGSLDRAVQEAHWILDPERVAAFIAQKKVAITKDLESLLTKESSLGVREDLKTEVQELLERLRA